MSIAIALGFIFHYTLKLHFAGMLGYGLGILLMVVLMTQGIQGKLTKLNRLQSIIILILIMFTAFGLPLALYLFYKS